MNNSHNQRHPPQHNTCKNLARKDSEGRQRLSRYMIRCPFSLEKMRYAPDSGMVIYRSKPHATLKRNYQLMPANTRRKAAWARLIQKVYEVDPPLPQGRDPIPGVSPRTGAPEEYSGQTVRTGDARIAKMREIGHARWPDQVPNHAATNPGPRLTRSFG
jgi:hypothetical protein